LGAEHLCRLFGLLQQARQKVSGAGILEAEGAGFTVGPELYK
jgi:hypothetical protein